MRLVKEIMTKVKSKIKRLAKLIHNQRLLRELDSRLKHKQLSSVSLHELFKDISDDFWFWLYTQSYEKRDILHQIMPLMPPEKLQIQFTGSSGFQALENGFGIYKLFKSIAEQKGVKITSESYVLDFGCGWGRIIRFFIKDVPASNLIGIDCDQDIINICENSNIKCNFYTIATYPPTHFSDNKFDIIYAFSVFSHLAEDIHKQWLAEFQRILKPNGVLIVTTWTREFIIGCAKIRDKQEEVPIHLLGQAKAFLNLNKSLINYDEGNYCFSPTGGGGVRSSSFYGETCIPKSYVETEWTKYFSSVEFIYDKEHKSFPQNIIIAQKDCPD